MPAGELTNFEKAQKIAAAAMYIDDNKPAHIVDHHTEAFRHAEFLHDLAEELAGDRVGEIYNQEEWP